MQTLSSQYRTQQTAKSFDGQQRFSMQVPQMPELKNAQNEAIDMSLAQIVQLGKSRQRELLRKGQEPRRAASYGAGATRPVRKPIEIDDAEEEKTVQADLTLAVTQDRKRTSTSSQSGQSSARSNNKRLIFRDEDSKQRTNRMITAPAFITQNRGAY